MSTSRHPADASGGVFKFVDPNLDLEVVGGGPPVVLDRDEFIVHTQAWDYPAESVTAAEATCRDVADLLTNRRAPFEGSYLSWWELVAPP